jgi:PAS domain S-box-containing protein
LGEGQSEQNIRAESVDVDFAEVVETDTDAVVVYDRAFRYRYVNREAEKSLGRSRDALLGKVLWEVFPETIGTEAAEVQRRAMRVRAYEICEADLTVPGQTYEIRCIPIGGPEGGLVVSWYDITPRRKAEAELLRKSAEIVSIFESMTDAFVTFDRDWRFTYLNAQAEVLLRRSRADLLGRDMWEAFPEAVGSVFDEMYRRALDRGETVTFEGFYPPVDAWFEVRAYPSEAGLSVYFRDVTARRRADEERERLQAQLREASQRQRRFLKEILYSVTEGRLMLCEQPSDLPAPLPQAGGAVPLSLPTLKDLRRRVEEVAGALLGNQERVYDFETAVGEAAMNAVVHGSGGEGSVYADPETGVVQVWVEDAGKGISEESLHRATLEKGFSSAGTLGHGFWMMLKTADRVYLLTSPQGTTIVLEQERTPPEPPWMRSANLATARAR